MKKLVLSAFILFLLLSCGSRKKVVETEDFNHTETEQVVNVDSKKTTEEKTEEITEKKTNTTKKNVNIFYKPIPDQNGNNKPFSYNDGKNNVNISGTGEVNINLEENEENIQERTEINSLLIENENLKLRVSEVESKLSVYSSKVTKTNSMMKYVIAYAMGVTFLLILLVFLIARWWIRKKKRIFVPS